jgi:hypothetical protein
VVLENAGTRGHYTKRCFSSRLYSLVLQVRAPEYRERGTQIALIVLRTTGAVTLIEEDKVSFLPKLGSTTDENPECTSSARSRPFELSYKWFVFLKAKTMLGVLYGCARQNH